MIPTNPYIAGNPVFGDDTFVGRSDVLVRVQRVLKSPQSNAITLFGQRRIGKTSILKELERRLPLQGPYHTIYFDLQDKASWSLDHVLYEMAQEICLKLAFRNYDRSLFQDEMFYQTEFLPSVIAKLKPDESIVFLFDEFDVLDSTDANRAGVAFFPYLRQLLQTSTDHQKFIFVIGRKLEDLSNITLSLFKGIESCRISMLSKADTESVVRVSERNRTLLWDGSALESIWNITNGHPYLTQLLCGVIWDQLCLDDYVSDTNASLPIATQASVEVAVTTAFERGANAFQWIWGGLPPAERVIMAAIAEHGSEPISDEELDAILQKSGVRVVIRELELAPTVLIEWDLLEAVNDKTYRFRVELLRQWIALNKPITRVKDELDRLNPLAETLFQGGNQYYKNNQSDLAIAQLQSALTENPNHLKARLLLGKIWIEQSQYRKARQILESAFEYDPAASRSYLEQALFALSELATDEGQIIQLLGRILEIHPDQYMARRRYSEIWARRGQSYLAQGMLTQAYEAYAYANDRTNLALVENLLRQEKLGASLKEVKLLEEHEKWLEAAAIYQKMLDEFPMDGDWHQALSNAQEQGELLKTYKDALHALDINDRASAINLLASIIGKNAYYKDTIRRLYFAVEGLVDGSIPHEFGPDRESSTVPHIIERDHERRNIVTFNVIALIVVFIVALLLVGSIRQ